VSTLLAPARALLAHLLFIHLTIAALVLGWDVFMSGQIAALRRAPHPFAVLTGLSGLLVVPATLVAVASVSLLYGRAINSVAWLWPLCCVLFALQALYATARRLITSFIGVPLAAYDVILAIVAVTRQLAYDGVALPPWALALGAAHATTLGYIMGRGALSSPLALQIPMLSPAFPARWRLSRTVRAALAAGAAISAGVTALEIVRGYAAVRSYDRYAAVRLQERPAGDFQVGMTLFPELTETISPSVAKQDVALLDTLDVDVVMVTVDAGGARAAALDSLARTLDPFRRDSTALIVALGYAPGERERLADSSAAYGRARLADVERIVRRLRPDYLLPADEPYGRGADALGTQPVAYWERFLTDAAARARRADRRVKVGVALAGFGSRDSALYAWATAPRSPLDLVGFTMVPGFRGGLSLEARLHAADRWMRVTGPSRTQHWVLAAGGYPVAHGEVSQERAVWGALAWATSRPALKGVIVQTSDDYTTLTGLRAANGRLRPVAAAMTRAVKGLREGVAP
jgi:hypothetical protein